MNAQDPKPARAADPPQPKQPYTAPVVRVEGSIEKLTQAVGVEGADGVLGSTV